jgi:hypothetical protein
MSELALIGISPGEQFAIFCHCSCMVLSQSHLLECETFSIKWSWK